MSLIITEAIKTTFVQSVSKEFRNIVNETIAAYSEKIKIALNNNKVSYKIGNKMIEMHPELKGIIPTGVLHRKTWNSISGKYNLNSKVISISEFHWLIGRKVYAKHSEDQIRNILHHETGHGFDWSKVNKYSDTLKFKIAYKEDLENIPEAEKNRDYLKFYIQDETGRLETFAEIFAEIVAKNIFLGKACFPNCKKYIDDLLN